MFKIRASGDRTATQGHHFGLDSGPEVLEEGPLTHLNVFNSVIPMQFPISNHWTVVTLGLIF